MPFLSSGSTRRSTRTAHALSCLILLALIVGLSAEAAPAALNLDAFDRTRSTVSLPDGVTLAYREFGSPAGKPLVLIHGYTDSGRDWLPLIPFIDASRRIIVVDLRGHGGSGKPECCYTRFDFAYDIMLLLDALKIGRADVVGHSLGAVVAQTFAEQWPDRTGKLVLISSPAAPARATEAPGEQGPATDFSAQIARLKEPIDPDSPFMIAWYASPNGVDAAFLRRQRQDASAIPLRVWLAVLDQISSIPASNRLKAPCLLLWGSKDPIVSPQRRRDLAKAIPKARVHAFAGLGHNPFWERPGAVADRINAFLGSG